MEVGIPNIHNKTSVHFLIADIYNDIYSNTEIDTPFGNIDLSNYYTKTETQTTYYDKVAMDSPLATQIYTDSENIDITNNQISLAFPLKSEWRNRS